MVMRGRAVDICDWLRAVGLDHYEQTFRENALDWDVLTQLNGEVLKDLGMPLGDRLRLLKAISLLDGAAGPPAATASPKSVDTSTAGPGAAERRQLTVMFCDLVGYTALAAGLDPEDTREVIRAFQNAVAGEIGRLEGHVAKFMGDGVLAYFGWPRAHEDEAERAVRAGRALVAAVGQLETAGHGRLAVRVGIATGLVVVGDLIGEGSAQEEAVVGETPNLAARLQALAEPGQVVIAEGTRRLVGASFELRDLGDRVLKGIDEPVRVFAVVGEKATESRFEAKSGRSVLAMVGRDPELALLMERWSRAKAGEGQGLLLVGEAGIGKSRITRALLDALSGEPHTRIRYQCSPYHRDSALWPVIQQFFRAAGLASDDPPERRLDKLEALLAAAGEDNGDAAPLIANLIGLDGGERYGALDLTPEVRRVRTLAALVRQLLGLAAKQPVLVVLEDAHWIDPTTLKLIENCLAQTTTARVLILLTTRPDQQPDLSAHAHVTRLTLNRLSRAAAEAIVRRLGGEALPGETLDTIVRRTDGVPLFVEELTKAVLETGEATVPDSLHDSLMARLDRIPEVKEVAQIASCIGREFGSSLLAQVANRSEADLETSLAKLADAEILIRRGNPEERCYLFKHALVRDAAYQSLLRRTRQIYHRQVAELMEANFQEETSVQPELLAHHYSEAGVPDRAIRYWQRAGERANERSAHAEAIAHLNKGLAALALLADSPERASQELALQVPLASALQMMKGHTAPEVEATYNRARELCHQFDGTPELIPVSLGLWRCHITRADLGPARRMSEQLRRLADLDGDPATRVTADFTLGWTTLVSGDFATAEDALSAGIERYRPDQRSASAYRIGHDPGTGCLIYRAMTQWLRGYPDRARAGVADAMRLAETIAHPFSTAHVWLFGAVIAQLMTDLETVEERAAVATAVSTEQRFVLWAAGAEQLQGWALARRGRRREGLERMRNGLAGWNACGARLMVPFYLGCLADIHRVNGQSDEAILVLEDALELAESTGEQWFAAELHRIKGRCLLAQTQTTTCEAEGSFEKARAIASQQGARSLELRAACDLSRLWIGQGERQKALALLAPLHDWFSEGFDTVGLIEAKALIDELG